MPNLSIQIPNTSSMGFQDTSAKEVKVEAFFTAEDFQDKEDESSNGSSICHSPRWDDAKTRKERKQRQEKREQRKKEKERTAKEEKRKEQKPQRLTKLPPKKVTQQPIITDRSNSAPAVPTIPDMWGKKIEKWPEFTASPLEEKSGFQGPEGLRMRPRLDDSRISRASDGFIGGLKLKQADAGMVLQSIRRQTSPQESKHDFVSKSDSDSKSRMKKSFCGSHEPKKSIDFMEQKGELSSHHDSPITRWPTALASPLVKSPPARPERSERPDELDILERTGRPTTLTPIMDRQIKRSHQGKHKSKPSQEQVMEYVSPDKFGRATASIPHSESSISVKSPKASKFDNKERPKRPARNGGSPERPPVSYRQPQQLAAGIEPSTTYHRNQHRQNNSFGGFENGTKDFGVSNLKPGNPKGRSWSIKGLTRKGTKDAESSRPPTREEQRGTIDFTNFITNPLVPTRMNPVTPNDIPQTCKLSKLSPTSASFVNLTNATKAISKRDFYTPGSPSADFKFQIQQERYLSRENKHKPQSDSKFPPNLNDFENPTLWKEQNISHSRSTTSSSELTVNTDYTTPSASRSHSRKRSGGLHPRPSTLKLEETKLFNDNSQVYETWRNTRLPNNQQDAQFKGSVGLSNDIQTHPSLLRSVSSPDLKRTASQAPSFSFLPELKHQSFSKHDVSTKLTPVPKGKEKEKWPLPLSPTTLSPLRPPSLKFNQSRSRPSSSSRNSFSSMPPEQIAKMLVRCCSCHYFHDMPSRLYEVMAKPENVVEDQTLGVSGVISSLVRCPWCEHGMSVRCCEGWVVEMWLRERLH